LALIPHGVERLVLVAQAAQAGAAVKDCLGLRTGSGGFLAILGRGCLAARAPMAERAVAEAKAAMVVPAGRVPAGVCFSRRDTLRSQAHLSGLTPRSEAQEPVAVRAVLEATVPAVVTEAVARTGVLRALSTTQIPARTGEVAEAVARADPADPAERVQKVVQPVSAESGRVVVSMSPAERSTWQPTPLARTARKVDQADQEVGAAMAVLLV